MAPNPNLWSMAIIVFGKMSAARLTFATILKKYSSSNHKELLYRGQHVYLNNRLRRAFATVPLEYKDRDPAPVFFAPNVQRLLKYVTRPEVGKVFRKRNNKGDEKLRTPEYKFMTDEELQKELRKAEARAEYLLQMPPALTVYDDKEPDVICVEPALTQHDNSKFVFTDITFGLKDFERFITVRETDGSLHEADHETRKKCLQIYFPTSGREFLEPAIFTDQILFEDLLKRKEYEFVLDRACVQYDPEEINYQRIANKVYLHIDEIKDYRYLRSTRHFGSMTFFLSWNNIIDNLLLEMLQSDHIREAVTLVHLQRVIHPNLVSVDDTKPIVEEIVRRQRLITDQSNYEDTTEDIELDKKCIDCIDKYIRNNSSKKAVQELAFQAYQDAFRNKLLLQEEIKTAHGIR